MKIQKNTVAALFRRDTELLHKHWPNCRRSILFKGLWFDKICPHLHHRKPTQEYHDFLTLLAFTTSPPTSGPYTVAPLWHCFASSNDYYALSNNTEGNGHFTAFSNRMLLNIVKFPLGFSVKSGKLLGVSWQVMIRWWGPLEFSKFPNLNRNNTGIHLAAAASRRASTLWKFLSHDPTTGSAWVGVGQRGFGKAVCGLVGTTWARLSRQVTNESGVQGLFQDIGPMQLGHVECGRRGNGVAGTRVALTRNGGGGHVQWGRTLLVVLALLI